MKRDWRAIAALVTMLAAFSCMIVQFQRASFKIIDWERNGDPCERARESGQHFGFCTPVQMPDDELYLFIAWASLLVIAIGLLIWIFWKPLKR